jgi:hypothetical protein
MVAQSVQAQRVALNTFNGCAPVDGPKVIPVVASLAAGASEIIDFLGQVTRKEISMVQGVYIDNSQNPGTVTLNCNSTNQTITLQPGTQGYFPILATNPPRFVVSSSDEATIGLQFFNFPISPLQWGPQSGGGSTVNLVEGGGITLTPNPISGSGEIAAAVDGSTITINGDGELQANFPAQPSGADPTATAGPAAINGTATTFMRSDAAPAIQKASATQFGIVEVDGTSIQSIAGVISAHVTVPVGATPTATAGASAIAGSAATFMRSDGAPALTIGTTAAKGIVQADGTTIAATSGVIGITAAQVSAIMALLDAGKTSLKATINAATSFPNSAVTKVAFGVVVYDNLTEWSITNSNFTAQKAGLYLFTGSVYCATSAGSFNATPYIYVNGTQIINFSQTPTAVNACPSFFTAMLNLNAADVADIRFSQASGATQSGSTNTALTYVTIARI